MKSGGGQHMVVDGLSQRQGTVGIVLASLSCTDRQNKQHTDYVRQVSTSSSDWQLCPDLML
jgi:hypothetical protein